MANSRSAKPNRPRSALSSGLDILELLAADREVTTLSEAARRLGMSKSSVHSLMAALLQRGYVERGSDGGYRLGLKAWEIGCAVPSLDLAEIAAPAMTALVAETGEGAILGVLVGFDVVYIHSVPGEQAVQVHTRIGDRIPAHCTSTGLALMAALPPDEVSALVPEALEAFTPETIVERDSLLQAIERTRARGHSVNRGGWRIDVGGIAVPVVGEAGRAVAGLCVAAPCYRMTKRWLASVVPATRRAARLISDALGGGAIPGDRAAAAR